MTTRIVLKMIWVRSQFEKIKIAFGIEVQILQLQDKYLKNKHFYLTISEL